MIQQIEELLDQYRAWLREKTTLKEVGGWVEITTPYLDRHNDHIQIYARRDEDRWTLSDDGYVISDLVLSGCNLDTTKRRGILEMTLNGFGVKVDIDQALTTSATDETFSFKKHNLVQAMLAVGDLFYLAEPNVASIFQEDVSKWMSSKHIRYTPNVKITGRSGLDFRFEFIVPRSEEKPERLVRLINNPTRDHALNVIACWVDIRDNRPDSRALAFLNDQSKDIPPGIMDALDVYDIKPVPWSKRRDIEKELAA